MHDAIISSNNLYLSGIDNFSELSIIDLLTYSTIYNAELINSYTTIPHYFSSDNSKISYFDNDYNLVVYDFINKKVCNKYLLDYLKSGFYLPIVTNFIENDSQLLLITNDSPYYYPLVLIIDINTGEEIKNIVSGGNEIQDIKFSNDSKYIICSYKFGLIVVYDSETGNIQNLRLGSDGDRDGGALSICNNSSKVGITKNQYKGYVIWDYIENTSKYYKTNFDINCINFSEDGTLYAFGGKGDTVYLRKTNDDRDIAEVEVTDEIVFIAFHNDEIYIITDDMSFNHFSLRKWNYKLNTLSSKFDGGFLMNGFGEFPPSIFDYNYKSGEIVGGNTNYNISDNYFKIFNYNSYFGIFDNSISGDGKFVAQSVTKNPYNYDKNVIICNLRKLEDIKSEINLFDFINYSDSFKISNHFIGLNDPHISFSPDNKMLACGFLDGVVLVFNLDNLLTVNNEEINNDIGISPNPTTDKLLLKEIPDGATDLKVSEGEIANEINVAALPTGIYFLKIKLNDKMIIQKFLKI